MRNVFLCFHRLPCIQACFATCRSFQRLQVSGVSPNSSNLIYEKTGPNVLAHLCIYMWHFDLHENRYHRYNIFTYLFSCEYYQWVYMYSKKLWKCAFKKNKQTNIYPLKGLIYYEDLFGHSLSFTVSHTADAS